MKFNLVDWLFGAAIVFLLVSAFVGPPLSCASQAKAMGMKHDWGLFQGCMIEHKPGQWVPLKNYRVL